MITDIIDRKKMMRLIWFLLLFSKHSSIDYGIFFAFGVL
jgi:hypothetical protein